MGKTLKNKEKEYKEKYGNIPTDFEERLRWMYDEYKINPTIAGQILAERQYRIQQIYYTCIKFVLYLVPEGAKRPRYRLINRNNILDISKMSKDFIHVYSPDASSYSQKMRRLVTDSEIDGLHDLICTPCDVEYYAYLPTPNYYNREAKFIAEIGLDRPINKPDFDNIAKLYADMYNSNVWLDDKLTIRGMVEKYYSILPRVEINLNYMNTLYNKHQWKQITSSTNFPQGKEINYL